MPARLSRDSPPLPCRDASHIFDKTDVRDRWYNPEDQPDAPWVPCEEQPCRHRNNAAREVPVEPWASEVDSRQLRVFAQHAATTASASASRTQLTVDPDRPASPRPRHQPSASQIEPEQSRASRSRSRSRSVSRPPSVPLASRPAMINYMLLVSRQGTAASL